MEFVDIINMQKMNSKDTSVGGWPASAMREYLNVMDGKDGSGTIYNALPDEVKAGIINTKVISGHEKDKEENYTSNDKIYLLSTKEIYGSVNSYDTVNETRQLDFYKNQNASYDAAVKYYRGVEKDWWLRSAYSMDTSSFFNFLVAGNYDHNFASRNYGVSPAFRIG